MTRFHRVGAPVAARIVAAAAFVMNGVPAVLVAEGVTPQVALPLMKSAPRIDGVIHEDEWKEVVRNVGFVSHTTDRMTARDGVFWVGCDGTKLYAAVKTELPPDGRVLTRAVPDAKRDVRAAFLNDSIELVLDPKHGRTSGDRTYYHIITNGRGALFDWAVDPDQKRNPMRHGWRLRDWQIAQKAAIPGEIVCLVAGHVVGRLTLLVG